MGSSCNGGATGDPNEISASGPTLVRVEIGRLCDIYAWRMVDPGQADRMDPVLREPVLIMEDVVVRGDLQSEVLDVDLGCDPSLAGTADPIGDQASFRFRPFDMEVGHEELLILWDDRFESQCFDAALASATEGLARVEDAFAGQNPAFRPFPIVPRNAALQLVFDRDLGIANARFFESNPEVVQLLQIQGNVEVQGANVLAPLPVRYVPRGNLLILDPSIIGGEAPTIGSGIPGLPASVDDTAANIRLALPTVGDSAGLLGFATDRQSFLNDVDAQGNDAVVRDFRSANVADGVSGLLPDNEAPGVQNLFDVVIESLDPINRTVTVSKVEVEGVAPNFVVRGRVPFVDGQRPASGGAPEGPASVPTVDADGEPAPLVAGDRIRQEVTVLSDTGVLENVIVSAEVIEVLDLQANGLTAIGSDGGELPQFTLRLSNMFVQGPAGPVGFSPIGQNSDGRATAVVRYYENVPYASLPGFAVSDFQRRSAFIEARPASTDVGSVVKDLDPVSSVIIRFTEPLDLEITSALDNIVMTTVQVGEQTLKDDIADPKVFGLSVVPTRLVDVRGDGTEIELVPPLGLAHDDGVRETYWIHVLGDGDNPAIDLAGNALDVFDRRPENTSFNLPRTSLSIELQLDMDAAANQVGWKTYRFESLDEDGTDPAAMAPDWFGQGVLANGRLVAAPANRRRVTADRNNLGDIMRMDRGECFGLTLDEMGVPIPGSEVIQPLGPDPRITPPPMRLVDRPYVDDSAVITTSSMPGNVIYTFGGVSEPHVRFGARQQMTYRPDDVSLDPEDPADFNIDVEQMYWAPWNGSALFFDVFERYSMRLSHADSRPDMRFQVFNGTTDMMMMVTPPTACFVDCFSAFSGLSTTFAGNVLQSSAAEFVVQDAEYVVNPGTAFPVGGVPYVSYPGFEESYTWRDSRLVGWNAMNQTATGLGGARDAVGTDQTVNTSSPWVPNDPSTAINGAIPDTLLPFINGIDADDPDRPFRGFTQDPADFRGDRSRDHDPIALPLLVDLLVFPDAITSSVAMGGNQFHIAYAGPQYLSTGMPPNMGGMFGAYFAMGQGPCNGSHPSYRVYTSGGVNPTTNQPILVNPAMTPNAMGGLVEDLGLIGNPTQTLPGDPHVPWTAMDLVRRVSLQTFGFFDSRQPNLNELGGAFPPTGFPDLSAAPGAGAQDLVVLTDQENAPGASRILFEVRGVADADNITTVWNPATTDQFDMRGNLLNPNYACEAFRYASPNPGFTSGGPRVVATGLTNYVPLADIDDLRDSVTGALPRYLNFRLVLENDVSSARVIRPSLGGFSATWRIE